MVPIRELTVGSWVYDGDKTQFPMYVRTVGEDYVYLDFPSNEGDLWESEPEDLMGIPLTDGLMEKLGFTYKDGLWRHQCGIKVKVGAGFVNIEYKSEGGLYGTCNCKDVWHLHQLQNVIRTITKQELKIEL